MLSIYSLFCQTSKTIPIFRFNTVTLINHKFSQDYCWPIQATKFNQRRNQSNRLRPLTLYVVLIHLTKQSTELWVVAFPKFFPIVILGYNIVCSVTLFLKSFFPKFSSLLPFEYLLFFYCFILVSVFYLHAVACI